MVFNFKLKTYRFWLCFNKSKCKVLTICSNLSIFRSNNKMTKRRFRYFRWMNLPSSGQWVTVNRNRYCWTIYNRVSLTTLKGWLSLQLYYKQGWTKKVKSIKASSVGANCKLSQASKMLQKGNQHRDKETLINLRVDGEVKYTRLVKILDLLQVHKLENISLITEKDQK